MLKATSNETWPPFIRAIHEDGTVYHAKPDEQLHFSLAVKPGKYRLTATGAPFNLAQAETQGGSGACAFADLRITLDERISGTLKSAKGAPPPPVSLQLFPASDTESFETVETKTDASGHFEFTGLMPDSYIVSINSDRPPTAESPYKRLFYPAAPDREHAQVLRLSESTGNK